MKRAISLLLSILMVLSLCPVSALADDGSGVEPDTTGQVETTQPEEQSDMGEGSEEASPSDADASGEDDGDAESDAIVVRVPGPDEADPSSEGETPADAAEPADPSYLNNEEEN